MICISVVSHGQGRIAATFLQSLARLAPSLVSEVIYTRNIPEAEVAPPHLGHIALTIIENATPRGFGQNHNAAFARCEQPYFCVVNPDIILRADPFAELRRCMDGPDVGLVAPLITSPALTIENTARSLYTPSELIGQKLSPLNHGTAPAWLAGMFLLFSSQAYGSVDGFDERYFLYIEDVDICTRLRLAGWAIRQCQTCSVIHDARKESHRSPRFTAWHIGGMIRYWSSRSFWRYRSLLRKERGR